jgi:hypothetical protein
VAPGYQNVADVFKTNATFQESLTVCSFDEDD